MTLVVILTMKISIITPAFGQLNWLRMCIASVADQVGTQYESAKVNGGKVWMAESKIDGADEEAEGKSKVERRTSMARGVDSEGSQVSGFKFACPAVASHPLRVVHVPESKSRWFGGQPSIGFTREVNPYPSKSLRFLV